MKKAVRRDVVIERLALCASPAQDPATIVLAKTKHMGGTPDQACADCGKAVSGGVCVGCGKAADTTKPVSKNKPATPVLPTAGNGAGAASDPGDPAVAKTVDELTKENEALAKSRDAALRRAGMTDAEKAHEASLPEADRAAFVAQEPAARLDAVAKAKAADAVIYKSKRTGREYTRSSNPEIVALAKDADAAYEIATSEMNARKDGEYLAKAKTLNHLAGTDAEKVELLKAIDAIPDATARARQHELLASRNTEMAKAFAKAGITSTEPKDGTAEAELATLAKAKAATDKTSADVAMARILSTPEGQALYARSEQEREARVRAR